MSQPVVSSSNSKINLEAGFSLLELAIVLAILGVLGGFGLPLLTAHMNRAALLKTRHHQDQAVYGIAAYVEKNHRFPCPADPYEAGPSYGRERSHCRGQRAKGILPFQTLGISEIYARDGFKRLMTYGVEPELAKRDTTLQKEAGGTLTVQNEEGVFVIAPPQKGDRNPNYVAFVLMSHGKKSKGAFQRESPGEENSYRSKKNPSSEDFFTFTESPQKDIILRWESRDVFLKHYVQGI